MGQLSDNRLFLAKILALSAISIYALFLWQGYKGFSLWDEGYLWYGAQRVSLGEVPIRDFMAYDPGRYYWSAAFMRLMNDNGLITLRIAAAIFQAVGLSVGLLLIALNDKKNSTCFLLISAVTLLSWMFPYYRHFDISISIIQIGALALLIQSPTSKRYFVAGLCVGLAAVFGRNHGIYGLVGSVGVLTWLRIKKAEGFGTGKGGAVWLCGVITGYLPVLLMLLFVPGFAAAFWESILFLSEAKTTNITLPVPWPWQVDFHVMPSVGQAVYEVLVGVFFVALLVFGIGSLFWAFCNKMQNSQVSPELVASSFLALPYAHYALSRADAEHLALGISPLLVGCLILLTKRYAYIKWPLVVVICAASLWVTRVFHPGWQSHVNKQWVNIAISGANVIADPTTAHDVRLIRALVNEYAYNGKNFLVTPYWPGAYPLCESKSPIWEIYALHPRNHDFQRNEIERIRAANPSFIVMIDHPLDGREELRYRNTHSITYQYVVANYDRLQYSPYPEYQIYVPKNDPL